MLLYTRLAPPKVPKRRSRAGCTYCKEKKKKCDEGRPQCARCAERCLECTYEPVKPRQRRARDAATPGASGAASHGGSGMKGGARRFSDGSRDSQSGDDMPPREEWYASRLQGLQGGQHHHQFDDLWSEQDVFSPLESAFDQALLTPYPWAKMAALAPASGPASCGFAPDVEELDDDDDEGAADGSRSSNNNNHSTESSIAVRNQDSSSSSSSLHRLAMAVAAHHHQPNNNNTTTNTNSSKPLSPDLAMIAPIPAASPLRDFCAPAFGEFSDKPNRRALVDHFCNVLSHLIVFREESGNPFQQLVLPMTRSSTPVMNAIYALASAHLEYRGVENGEKSLYFHNQAIQGLTRLIEHDEKVNRNELLAAIMLLVYYEVLVQKARSNIVEGHLKGALAIMRSNADSTNPTSVFLERAFRFYDVIAALSFGTAPLSTAPAAGCLAPFPPLGAPAASPLSNVDTLLGMATTLWPIIHRLSTLRSLKSELEKVMRTNPNSSKAAVLRTELQTTADAIKSALKQWQPCLPPNFVPDANDNDEGDNDNNNRSSSSGGAKNGDVPAAIVKPPTTPLDESGPLPLEAGVDGDADHHERGRIHSILHNALAYRHSAFVYLYRTIYGHDRAHPLVQQHAHAALAHCDRTVHHAGPMGALLWPLFVAACEAVAPQDRALAGRAFAAIERRQGMTNIKRAWEIVSEVWRRADEIDAAAAAADAAAAAAAASAAAASAAAMPSPMAAETPVLGRRVSGAPPMGPAVLIPGMATGLSSYDRDGGGPDLWRRVSRDMGVNIVFG